MRRTSQLFLNYAKLAGVPYQPSVCTMPWSSWVEGDEQLDRPNSQTCMECFYAYAA